MMPFINKELQQFCLHLNINNNTFQTLGYQDFLYFDGESGMTPNEMGITLHSVVMSQIWCQIIIYIIVIIWNQSLLINPGFEMARNT